MADFDALKKETDELILKTFVFFEQVATNAGSYWRKHVTVGDLECCEFNKKEKYAILRLKNYNFHLVLI